jgi:PKD repeat protein
MLGAAILVAVGGAIGCGGSGGSTTRNAGTSAGSYTVTLTASNGSLNASTTVSVTVQ